MKVRVSLHNHTKEDMVDGKIISHTIYELIDEAVLKDIRAIALTCHNKFVFRQEYKEYAASRGILLISGIELSIKEGIFRRSHVLILNCDSSVEAVHDFLSLREYRRDNPEIFIIAPHPFFDPFNSISKTNLLEYMDVFDAIENSWFYSDLFNLNDRVRMIAEAYDKPFISTADVHFLDYLDSDLIVADVPELDEGEIFSAIRGSRFDNKTHPKKTAELITAYIKMTYLNIRAYFI